MQSGPSRGRGHWLQQSSCKKLTPKIPHCGQMREGAKESWKPMPTNGWRCGAKSVLQVQVQVQRQTRSLAPNPTPQNVPDSSGELIKISIRSHQREI